MTKNTTIVSSSSARNLNAHANGDGNTSSHLAARIGFYLGPILLIVCLVIPPPTGMPVSAWTTVGMTLLIATWWSTEAIPIPITSLLPILLIPTLGIGEIGDATVPYANPIIYLFLGGFILGLAMERWNLHRRIALNTLMLVGSSPSQQIAGFMLSTAFLSMWVSNTATTIMMLPIGMSVVHLLDHGKDGSDNAERARFATALLLGIAYAASIGGVATLIGTPPNAMLAGFLQANYEVSIGFSQWMLLGIPVAATMLLFTWWWLTRRGFKLHDGNSRELIRAEIAALGPWSKGEKMVSAVFSLTALSWIFKPFIANHLHGINDTSIALTGALSLFLIPVDTKQRIFLMCWKDAVKLPWGVLLLFGGGLSLAATIQSTGLAEWIADSIGSLGTLPLLGMIALVTAVIIFLTEVTSNTATAAAFLPLLAAVAISQGFSVEMIAIPAAIAASCAFMLPVATPPNAIVFSTGHMRIKSMVTTGFWLNIGGVLLVTFLSYFIVGSIWIR
ncbi:MULTISPECIES: DASS family sodium-coupled anion symporter [unclassified Modicisalibacter]|uniref:SLC13 family permease n=1 Tax=unclassified Modicisalibacter TaxID=2679913 RepID=UPI001CC979E7|nr:MULTISPECIES: DASS family sodium-coupled anion symporter [unclassified Modicisalibacter]MBZ9557997.1 DASS family sodium-coupled anion symporter [Modicisalibacter sp. R2A 31.J]MBZ9573335.1 DASS family sodium-coupled anion symporter [Modicisalibacter sp. MOD 31.J]